MPLNNVTVSFTHHVWSAGTIPRDASTIPAVRVTPRGSEARYSYLMAKPTFRVLEHAADIRLRAWGDTTEDLLLNAIRGAMKVALGRAMRAVPTVWHTVAPWPEAHADQVVTAVNEALFHLYARRLCTTAVRLEPAGAALGLAPLPPGRSLLREVKAATYHHLRVQRLDDRWRAELTLDL